LVEYSADTGLVTISPKGEKYVEEQVLPRVSDTQ
jgi:hypothetical protein